MTIFFDALNRANPNNLASCFKNLGLGQLLAGQMPQTVRLVAPVASTSQLSTVFACGLPNTSRATSIHRAYSRTGTTGELTVGTTNSTPTGANIAVAPNGDIVVSASTTWTSIDVDYLPARGDVVTLTNQPVTSNVFTIPSTYTSQGVVYLLSCTALTGTVSGANIVVAPGVASSTTKQVNLNLAKTQVQFVVADAVTSCTVTLLVGTVNDLAKALAGSDLL